MRVIICGDRNWSDYELIHETMIIGAKAHSLEMVIEGGARGADTIAGELYWMLSGGCEPEEYLADWDKYGRSAGPIRNRQMLKEGNPRQVWAFHDDIENSKGTKDMLVAAKKAGVITRLINHENVEPCPCMWCVPLREQGRSSYGDNDYPGTGG